MENDANVVKNQTKTHFGVVGISVGICCEVKKMRDILSKIMSANINCEFDFLFNNPVSE